MESLNQPPRFCYHSGDSEGDIEFSGILEVFAHHARNIHNICIYDNQDVYAKFSLTYSPDAMVSTQVIIGGGKNPEFNQKLELKVNQIDAILKCEIWMLSRVKSLMEDQLLGFALVAISEIISKGGKISFQDYCLSSTDLFHSPAGTVQLSLKLSSPNNSPVFPLISSVNSNPCQTFVGRKSSIASEVVLLHPKDYYQIEFPDINAAREDQMIISKYLNSNSHHALGSFLHLGSVLRTEDSDDDDEMAGPSVEENDNSPRNQNSGLFSSTMTSISDEKNTADSSSVEKRSMYSAADQAAASIIESETGMKQSNTYDHQEVGVQRENLAEIEGGELKATGYGNTGRVFSGRVGNMDLETEQTAMQQQIVDMYMKSMQQFTESLAKMKLPMDINPNPDDDNNRNVIRIMERSSKLEVENKKKDGSRVFYGSRAFF